MGTLIRCTVFYIHNTDIIKNYELRQRQFSHNPHCIKAIISHFPDPFPQITEPQLYHQVEMILKVNPDYLVYPGELHIFAQQIEL